MSGPGAHDKEKRTGDPPKHQKDMYTTGIMGSNAQLRNRLTGYTAGIIAGISYGMNPLFGKELLAGGAPVSSVLFFRHRPQPAADSAHPGRALQLQQPLPV